MNMNMHVVEAICWSADRIDSDIEDNMHDIFVILRDFYGIFYRARKF